MCRARCPQDEAPQAAIEINPVFADTGLRRLGDATVSVRCTLAAPNFEQVAADGKEGLDNGQVRRGAMALDLQVAGWKLEQRRAVSARDRLRE